MFMRSGAIGPVLYIILYIYRSLGNIEGGASSVSVGWLVVWWKRTMEISIDLAVLIF